MCYIINKIRNELAKNANEKDKLSGARFFKEDVSLYGVKSSVTGKIAKENFKLICNLPKEDIFKLCEELWQSSYLEESFIACNWSYNLHNKFEPADFKRFEYWVNTYISNWASCDTLCNHTVGTFIMMYPRFINQLKSWCLTKNRWTRRAAAVSLIIPARKALFADDIFEIADILLRDTDDMVQKGYGWMLKVTSQVRQKEVFDFVVERKSLMPRTALRYAIEKMPAEMKKIAMEN